MHLPLSYTPEVEVTLTEEQRRDVVRLVQSLAAEWSRHDQKIEADKPITSSDNLRLDSALRAILGCVASIASEAYEKGKNDE